jgi:hypothetical protein
MTNIRNPQIWKIELIWWLITAVIVAIFMLPIYTTTPAFPLKGVNILYIALAVTYTRYIFLFRYTPFAWSIPFKIFFPCSALIILILMGDGLMELQNMLDEDGFLTFLSHLDGDTALTMFRYIRSEYFFFGVTCVICSILLPIRMLVSIWRQKNRGTI